MENEFQSRSLEVTTRSYIFMEKKYKPHHPDIIFNDNPVKKRLYQKQLGMFLDSKLDFDEHIKGVFDKTRKSIGLIRKLPIFYLGFYRVFLTET